MGIKSTKTLTRRQAEEMYSELMSKLYGTPPRMTNAELGDKLDELREEECKRERTTCFDNYLVVDDDTPCTCGSPTRNPYTECPRHG